MFYIIGGSPCSGKSTISSQLANQYGLRHIKLDDLVDELAQKAAQDQAPICLSRKGRTSDQIWLRQPEEMAEEEWHFYEEIFPYLLDYLGENREKAIILEGAGCLPHLVQSLQFSRWTYVCMTATADFQLEHYAQRDWVPYVLKESSNPEQAFDNWMQRDILFAQKVRKEAETLGYPCLTIDGSLTENRLCQQVAQLLNLTEKVMTIQELCERSRKIRQAYHKLEENHHGSIWTVEEDLLALTNDIGNMTRLVMTKKGRYYDETPYSLEQKLVENVWWLVELAERLEIDFQAEMEHFLLERETALQIKQKLEDNDD